MSMETAIAEFLENYNSEHTKRAYRKDLIDFQNNTNVPLSNTSLQDFISYRDLLLKTQTPKTVARKLASLKSLMKYLTIKGHLPKNPTDGLKLPKGGVTKPTQALSDSEVRKILELSEKSSERDFLILSLFLASGMRCSELISLSVNDVFENGEHLVIRIEGKGGKVREIPVQPKIQNLLKKRLAESQNLIFDLNSSTIYRLVVKYASLAKVKKRITPHSLRATVITKALEEGAIITEVAEFAGHSQINTTQMYFKRRRGLDASPVFKLNY